MPDSRLFAAIDLGSNSFRLEIGELSQGHLRRVEYLKETVRQGGGLDADRHLTPQAMDRGWACLARFGERIANFDPARVRAVATQTLREARNRDAFLTRAQAELGFPIEVIAGREEARLIYLGVSHLLADTPEQRLVLDIGGRSTELILGQGRQAHTLGSYRVGSVAWSDLFFQSGWSDRAFARARVAAQAVLEEAQALYPRAKWTHAYGASGTVGAVAEILAAHGLGAGPIERDHLGWLQAQLVAARTADKLQLAGLKDERRPVLAGGLAVLQAVFEVLQVDALWPAQGALRHGALFDLMDRENPLTDVREGMINWLMQHHRVDMAQAQRVDRTAQGLLNQLLAHPPHGWAANMGQHTLHWAAQLHEIGKHMAHNGYHKHGAYILAHTDVLGFTLNELHPVGQLVLGQRGKLRKVEAALMNVPGFAQMLLCLRLAVLLCHARRDPDIQGWVLSKGPKGKGHALSAPPGWAQRFPQSAHLLQEEALAWGKTEWPLALDGA